MKKTKWNSPIINTETISGNKSMAWHKKHGQKTLLTIGYVSSPYKNTNDIPIKREISSIKILDEFIPGLNGLMSSSHIIVLGYLHLADKDTLIASPRLGVRECEEKGIFSVRSPARPNPVGYTVVRLLGINNGEVTVEGLDFIDGTPIIDIKPYSPGWDSIHIATRARRISPHEMDPEKTLDLLLRDAKNFSGKLDGEGLMAVAMVFVMATKHRIDPRNSNLRIEVNQPGTALDALMGMCGATFGSGRIKIIDRQERLLTFRFYWKNLSLIMKAEKEKSTLVNLTPETAGTLVRVSEKHFFK